MSHRGTGSGPRRVSARRLSKAALALLVLACADLTSGDVATINRWLTCVECSDGELQDVLALASDKPEATTDTLGAALLRGPTSTERNNLRQQFAQVYQQVTARVGPPGLPVSQAEYVAHYLDNVVAIYRIRAGQALARIPGPDPKQYLLYLLQDSVSTPGDSIRPDVARALFIADSTFNP